MKRNVPPSALVTRLEKVVLSRIRMRSSSLSGAGENCELSISQAVQASSALPIFYKPARLNGVDYVDGGVRHTANIDVAIEKGADLIICYNPFRPFLNRIDAEDTDTSYFAEGRYLADRGLKAIINQVFRTLLGVVVLLGDRRRLEFRLEAFNVTNVVIFDTPSTDTVRSAEPFAVATLTRCSAGRRPSTVIGDVPRS